MVKYRRALGRWGWVFVLVAITDVQSAFAAPVGGFVEHFTGTSLHGWSGGAIYSNPGTGGSLGNGDGYLLVSTTFNAKLGTFSIGSEYAGDWRAAGITSVKVRLRDVGTDDALEIHFAIGRRDNLWQYNPGFAPPTGSWVEYTIDLTNAANFTQTHGTGTFQDALSNVGYVHFRHDLAPYVASPEAIRADFGIDQLTLVSAPTPVSPTTWGKLKALYR